MSRTLNNIKILLPEKRRGGVAMRMVRIYCTVTMDVSVDVVLVVYGAALCWFSGAACA